MISKKEQQSNTRDRCSGQLNVFTVSFKIRVVKEIDEHTEAIKVCWVIKNN